GSNTYLHKSIRKHGAEAFKVKIIGRTLDEITAYELEKFFIYVLMSYKPSIGYNGTLGEEGAGVPNEETRKKLYESSKKSRQNPETRKKLSRTWYKYGQVNWATGKKFTEEHRKKISDGHKGKVISEETRQRMRDAARGRKMSEEAK